MSGRLGTRRILPGDNWWSQNAAESVSQPINYENWQDIDFPLVIRDTGPNRPDPAVLFGKTTVPLWEVNDSLNLRGEEMIHGRKLPSAIQWHIHMLTNGTNVDDRYVKWELEWAYVNSFEQVVEMPTIESELLIPADTPAKTMIVREIELITIPEMTMGAHVYGTLTRIAADGAAPTGNIFAGMLQMHVLVASPGSKEMFSN